jgi:lipopolysaccharide export LptBFGC system permease protein LptF
MTRKEKSQSLQGKKHKDKATADEEENKEPDEEKAKVMEDQLKELPPEAQQIIGMFMSRERYMGPPPNPIASKINEKHIDTLLANSEKESEREYKRSIHQKYFAAFIIMIFVLLFVFLTVWLSSYNRDLYMDVIKVVIGFLGGFGSGYGIKTMKAAE